MRYPVGGSGWHASKGSSNGVVKRVLERPLGYSQPAGVGQAEICSPLSRSIPMQRWREEKTSPLPPKYTGTNVEHESVGEALFVVHLQYPPVSRKRRNEWPETRRQIPATSLRRHTYRILHFVQLHLVHYSAVRTCTVLTYLLLAVRLRHSSTVPTQMRCGPHFAVYTSVVYCLQYFLQQPARHSTSVGGVFCTGNYLSSN